MRPRSRIVPSPRDVATRTGWKYTTARSRIGHGRIPGRISLAQWLELVSAFGLGADEALSWAHEIADRG